MITETVEYYGWPSLTKSKIGRARRRARRLKRTQNGGWIGLLIPGNRTQKGGFNYSAMQRNADKWKKSKPKFGHTGGQIGSGKPSLGQFLKDSFGMIFGG